MSAAADQARHQALLSKLHRLPNKCGEKRCIEFSVRDAQYLAESWTGDGGRTFVYQGDQFLFWIEGAGWDELQLRSIFGVWDRFRGLICDLFYDAELREAAAAKAGGGDA